MIYSRKYIIILLLFPLSLSAQELIHVKGTAQVRVEDNTGKDIARQKAEELAMIDAINNTFGSYVEQSSNIMVENGKINYDIIGTTMVKGEWIRTTNIKFSEDIQQKEGDHGKENVVWIKCNISGEARKITSKANIAALALECLNIKCASQEFMNDQDMYLYFKSPIPGFLSVYIEEGDTTRRLFPYDSQGDESAVRVLGDTEYILFYDNERLDDFNESVDKIVLYTDKSIEYNTIHVVFSSEPYFKPLMMASIKNADGFIIPRSLPTGEFREWISDCSAFSSDFQAVKIRISIRKK